MNDKITKIKELGRRQGGECTESKEKKREPAPTHLFSDLHMHGVTCVHIETNKDNNLKVTKKMYCQ